MRYNTNTGVGTAINRIDGRLKVTGKAKYASEFPVKDVAFAYGLNSTVASGKIVTIDTAEAEKQPGVLNIITYKNAEKLNTPDEAMPQPSTSGLSPVLQSPDVHYFGEFIGVVVAETFEQAHYASKLIKVTYEKKDPDIVFEKNLSKSYNPKTINAGTAADTSRGDVEKGLNNAYKTIEATYTTPVEHHHPMELHALIAEWKGDKLTVYLAAQMVEDAVTTISETFQIPKENVRVIAPYIGGGFGSKLKTQEHASLAIMAARKAGRPVQLTLTRQQMFMNVGFRQLNHQKVRLGANEEGHLTALSHIVTAHTSTVEEFQEQSGAISSMLYNVPNSEVKHRLLKLNLPTPTWMRAPGEAPGSFALESAMDELAYTLKIDPVEFRIKNDTQKDLSTGMPFSSRLLKECINVGVDKFGWRNRKSEPRTNKNGDWLIGHGMSAASRKAPLGESSARVILRSENNEFSATVELDATDIGTGSYTIIAQTAAEYLQIPVDRITVNIGDSNFPVTPGSGGSWGAASYTNGTRAACLKAVRQLRAKAGGGYKDSSVHELMKKSNLSEFQATATAKPGEGNNDYSIYSFGANFAEVRVNEATGMVRIKKMVNVSSAGKILNPQTAYSQIIGGITWGVGMALTEQSVVEPTHGNFITRTLADYHMPVNLDLGDIEVYFLPEEDKKANPMGVKGIGELGITSVAAAIANAVFNATGKRIRELPITPEKLNNGQN